MSHEAAGRSSSWFKWWICTLLLLATTLNYMDRQTLSQTSKNIKDEFQLSNQQYGYLESAFNASFALGALTIGWLVDRGNVRVIYPLIVVGWSVAGFAAGFASSFVFLLMCRAMLGSFEAGNWPCGITTVRRVLKPEERALGNGMFQSGTALGAIITPLVVNGCLIVVAETWPDDQSMEWKLPFRIIGAIGILWAVAWLSTVRTHHVQEATTNKSTTDSYWALWRDRRFWVLMVVVVAINITWRSFGAWLPMFLREAKGYSAINANYLSSAFFFSADLGSISVGFATLFLAKRGMVLHKARLVCFCVCSLLTMLTLVATILPAGWLLLGTLMLIGFGALGLFPLYFALSQELSSKHQGKVTGTLGCINALLLAIMFPFQGYLIDQTESFTPSLGVAGFAPVVALVVVYLFWQKRENGL